MKKIFLVLALALVAVAVAVPVVFAQDTTPPAVPFDAIQTLWQIGQAAPIAIVIAFASSLAGYLSSTPPESFSLSKFLYTALISVIIGFLTLHAGWSYTTIQTWLANGFMTWYLWKASNIIANTITKRFGQATQAVASAGAGPPK